MRLLFLLSHPGLYRIFERPLTLLADRGHEITVALDSERYRSEAFTSFVAARPNVALARTNGIATDDWAILGRGLRSGRDYLRYLEPRYVDAPKLRYRARRQVPAWLRPMLGDAVSTQRVDAVLRSIEARLPVNMAALRFLERQCPDAVAVSPLFGFASQREVLRAARVLGLPTCLAVASWDNLTSKGLIRPVVDRVLVWNEAQRTEAMDLHGVAPECLSVTGAQTFDEWFGREASTDYASFVARLGLRVDRPLLLYLGSSGFIAPDEARFVARWLAALRNNPDERLRDVGVLIRPHPQNARHWASTDLLADPQVAVHPAPAASAQVTGLMDWSRTDSYDSMHHAAAVIGVNTTAMIEAAVLGRGVFSMLAPDFRATQAGTLHFEHLRSAGGGLLHLSTSFDEHFSQLADAVEAGARGDSQSRRFVEAFVRPHGLDRPAAPLVADALEGVVTAGPVGRMRPGRPPLALRPLAAMAGAHHRHAPKVASLLKIG